MIDATAMIHPTARVGKNVSIGPYCVVGPNVTLHDYVCLISHVSITGHTTVGNGTTVYPFSSIGHPPQDLKYAGEESVTIIGQKCIIREYVTIQPGTSGGIMKTVVGDNCLLMVGVHVAHDCILGSHIVMANNATLGGHVQIGDHVIVGGLCAVQQFVRIGSYAMIGGMSGVDKDVIPFGLVMGERATLHGINLVGLKRHHFQSQNIQLLQEAYKFLFLEEEDKSSFQQRIDMLKDKYEQDHSSNACEDISNLKKSMDEKELLFNILDEFFTQHSKCRYCMPKKDHP
jgi:UDP-N-acetylglucosamine acyltransferase